jgi:hypothetical protein
MADCSPAVSQQTAEVNALNSKLGYDEELDNKREVLARQRAWEDLALRKATNAATIDHALNAGIVLAGQVGTTEGQQTVSPIRTGSGDAIAAVPGVAAGMVSMSGGDLAQIVAQTVAAIVPILITAIGGASTPSQTTPKPATGA